MVIIQTQIRVVTQVSQMVGRNLLAQANVNTAIRLKIGIVKITISGVVTTGIVTVTTFATCAVTQNTRAMTAHTIAITEWCNLHFCVKLKKNRMFPIYSVSVNLFLANYLLPVTKISSIQLSSVRQTGFLH